jgi:hypothetical protein
MGYMSDSEKRLSDQEIDQRVIAQETLRALPDQQE